MTKLKIQGKSLFCTEGIATWKSIFDWLFSTHKTIRKAHAIFVNSWKQLKSLTNEKIFTKLRNTSRKITHRLFFFSFLHYKTITFRFSFATKKCFNTMASISVKLRLFRRNKSRNLYSISKSIFSLVRCTSWGKLIFPLFVSVLSVAPLTVVTVDESL